MMPQLGETVTEGTITRWMKAVGDAVARDEPLFEVSTDKVDSEVPSPAAGVLTEILVPEGETVEVGVRLAVIGDGNGCAAAAPHHGARRPKRRRRRLRQPRLRRRPPTARLAARACRRAVPAPAAAPCTRHRPGTGSAPPAAGRRATEPNRAALAGGAQAAVGERDQRVRGHGHRRVGASPARTC